MTFIDVLSFPGLFGVGSGGPGDGVGDRPGAGNNLNEFIGDGL